MYAGVIPEPMPGKRVRRYIEQVEHPPVSVSLTQRLGSRLRRTNPWVLDAFLATVFLVIVIVGHFAAGGNAGAKYRDANAWSVLLSIAVAVPYYWRRHAPLAVLLVSELSVVLLTTGDYQTGAAPTVLLVGVYTVAAWCNLRDRVIGAAAVVAGLTVVGIVGIPGGNGAGLVFNVLLFAAAYLVGSTMRNRRLYGEQLEQRAIALERERDDETKRAVTEERLRIAQELHDVVAHSMGVIAVQAGVGAHVIDADPDEAKKSLDAISHTSRSTLAEIRRMLGVLRDDQGASYAPAPGLADLDRLIRDLAAVGLDAEVRSEGTRTELPPGVDFTAYRIVQEALTNVLKHAGRARATINIGYEENAVRLEILDDGRGVNGQSAPGGHGLMGMRERVSVYGGSFDAGPGVGGGFRVAVRLPYGEPA
jgi:signal transduction histidine kinase